MRLYRVPGYGHAYRSINRAIHARGWCAMRRNGPLEPDGDYLWHCSWCGRRSREETNPAWKTPTESEASDV